MYMCVSVCILNHHEDSNLHLMGHIVQLPTHNTLASNVNLSCSYRWAYWHVALKLLQEVWSWCSSSCTCFHTPVLKDANALGATMMCHAGVHLLLRVHFPDTLVCAICVLQGKDKTCNLTTVTTIRSWHEYLQILLCPELSCGGSPQMLKLQRAITVQEETLWTNSKEWCARELLTS